MVFLWNRKFLIATLGKIAGNTKRAEFVKCVDKCDLYWKSQHGFFEGKPGNTMQFWEEQQHKVNDVPSKEFTKIFKGF